jgi:multiple sugar transport system permease protein
VEIDNFVSIFKDSLFLNSVLTTLKFALVIVPVTIVLSLLIANMISSMRTGAQSFFKSSFYLPAVTSTVSLTIVWKWIYNPNYGLLNYLCSLLGINPVDWFGNAANAILALSIIVITTAVGQPVILYSAAILGIPATYYEAADLDGASNLKKLINITLPLLKPTTLYIMITTTIGSLQIFEVVILMTAGGPQYGTNTIMYLLYNTAFEYTKMGLASAMGIVMFILISIMALFQFKFLSSDIQY